MSDITSSNKFDHCSKLLQISKLNTKTMFSKYDTSEKFIDTKNNKVNILKTEFSEVETERRLNEYKNVLDNYSNYEIYDENNNCMLTNLKEFGLHFFDTNAEIEKDNFNIDKYVNDSSSDLDIFFDTASSQKLENVDSRESEYDETYNDKNINDVGICNDILVDNSKIESNIKTNFKYEANTEADEAESDENIKSDFRRLYNPIDSDKIFEIGIEDNLKCNFIAYENYNKIRIERENADIDEDSQIKDCIDVNTVQDAVTPQVQAAICLNTNQSDDSDTCSYHSSDFEFIDESEAFNGCTEGLMYNLNPSTKGIKNNSQVTVDISRELHTNIMKIENDYYNKPGPGVSKNNVIPRGDDYNNLFQHHCVPYPSRNIENKAVHSMKGMNVCDARFNMKFLLHRRDSNSKLKEEADESAKIIVSMYPYENKRISLRAKDK